MHANGIANGDGKELLTVHITYYQFCVFILSLSTRSRYFLEHI